MLLRVFLILAILAGAGVIAVTHFVVKPHVQRIIDTRNEYESNWKREEGRANKLQGELKVTTAKLAETTATLEQTQTELVATRTQADNEKKRADTLTQQLQTTTEERNAAQQELAAWNASGVKVDELKGLVADFKQAQEHIAATEIEKQVLQKEIKRLEARLAIYEGPETDPVMPSGTNGKVVVVDPKYDFIVMNIGEKHGVMPRGVFMISRDGKLVAKVRVSSIWPDRAIANVIPGWKLDDIHEGDMVVY